QINTDNEIYVSGGSSGDTGIATTGSVQEIRSGSRDLFLAKFDINGNLDWGTYYGGTDTDADGIISIFNNKLYLSGNTKSSTGISTATAAQPALNGGTDGLLVSINDCPILNLNAAILGPDTICENVEAAYSISPSDMNVNYNWILP